LNDATDAAGVAGGDETDNELLTELRALAARLDPVPAEAIGAARSAIAWRTIDAELAHLTGDPASGKHLAGVRSGRTPMLLTFEAPSLTVEVEVLETAAVRRLLGQLVPPTAGEIQVRHVAGTVSVAVDEVGRFTVDDVAPGPVSILCTAGPHVVQTDWFLA
jgi:hypothetical protein